MSPVGVKSGQKEANLIVDISLWNRQTQLGIVFSYSTIFSLPGGGDLSPNVAWISLEKWENITQQERESFPPISPDFLIELRSNSDIIPPLKAKMREYLESGLLLG
ncbi:Uma2 family endonuclease [Dapis sp. BLCC M229]|uniref:Uma2 family endonuclease n=1 Tax=Dapis sp. BLCC M229 TaxID=3400188 RepID=UPI003CF5B8F3